MNATAPQHSATPYERTGLPVAPGAAAEGPSARYIPCSRACYQTLVWPRGAAGTAGAAGGGGGWQGEPGQLAGSLHQRLPQLPQPPHRLLALCNEEGLRRLVALHMARLRNTPLFAQAGPRAVAGAALARHGRCRPAAWPAGRLLELGRAPVGALADAAGAPCRAQPLPLRHGAQLVSQHGPLGCLSGAVLAQWLPCPMLDCSWCPPESGSALARARLLPWLEFQKVFLCRLCRKCRLCCPHRASPAWACSSTWKTRTTTRPAPCASW